MNRNMYKKETFEDKFARKYYCEHARLNSVRRDKKEQHKKFRRDFKKNIDNYIEYWYNYYRKRVKDKERKRKWQK